MLICQNVENTINNKAALSHTHSVTDITSGVLPVSRGGTGTSNLAELKATLGIGVVGNQALNDVPTTLGSTYRFVGNTWIIVHVDTNLIYAVSQQVLTPNQQCVWPSSNQTELVTTHTYAGSDLAKAAESYQNNMTDEELSVLGVVSTSGISGKVFVPTKDHYNGGFAYFSSNDRRIGYDASGTATWYWTSTPNYVKTGGYWCLVYTNGTLSDDGWKGNVKTGFRPAIAFKRKSI